MNRQTGQLLICMLAVAILTAIISGFRGNYTLATISITSAVWMLVWLIVVDEKN